MDETVLEEKLNQLFVVISDMKRDVDELYRAVFPDKKPVEVQKAHHYTPEQLLGMRYEDTIELRGGR
jgi:hypothetical protein